MRSRRSVARFLCSMFFACSLIAMAAAVDASYLTAAPIGVTSGNTTVWELNGYGKYGQFDYAADILYNGETGHWSLSLPGGAPFVPGNYLFTAYLAGDDHDSPPASSYSALISIAGSQAQLITGIDHGTPYNGPFTNWRQEDFLVNLSGLSLGVTIENLLAVDGWIGIDRFALTSATTAPVPEPATMILLGAGMLGLAIYSKRRAGI